MQAHRLIRSARRRAGLTLRELARRAGTSHATLAAYEQSRKIPRADTLARIVRAAGFEPEVVLSRPAGERGDREEARGRKGQELEAVLELAEQFPARRHSDQPHAIFGRAVR